MTERQVIVSDDAQEDILYVAQYIIAVSRPDHAEKYAREVLVELATLNYMAVVLPNPIYGYVKKFHPEAKMMKLHGKPLCAIFHIEGDVVIIDRIIHSSMITY